MRVLDLFSCVGAHAAGLHAAGAFTTTRFVEVKERRRAILAHRFPGTPQHDDVWTYPAKLGEADIIIGGPPCQQTSRAAAVHGKRTGASLWPAMRSIADRVQPERVVVEQPEGSPEWEADVSRDLACLGYHTARAEFAVSDLGGPHPRRRVFILADRDLPRLEITWRAIPSEIAAFAGSGPDRNPWASDFRGSLSVDAGDGRGLARQQLIEAVGDSNPPAMMEVIGRALLTARATGGAA